MSCDAGNGAAHAIGSFSGADSLISRWLPVLYAPLYAPIASCAAHSRL